MTMLNSKTILLTALITITMTGIAKAETAYHDVVRTSEGEIVRNTYGNCVRTQWLTDEGYCAPRKVAQATVMQNTETRKAASLTQEERTVYFEFNRSKLGAKSKANLDTLVSVLKADASVKSAKVVGYADRIGTNQYNDKLSKMRAETIRNYIVAQGYTNATVTSTRWVGETEPSTNCSSHETRTHLIACLQNDRRVTVEIEYQQLKQISDNQ